MEITTVHLKIHEALHGHGDSIFIGGKIYPILRAANGCRKVEINDVQTGDVTIMEQNRHKNSQYAQAARNGATLSWIIPRDGSKWTLIDAQVKPIKDEKFKTTKFK